ncbi:hypothetical protein BDR07DRAFT_1456877 [Suillus spraguei]|nr:hypothetical protein BDR07DRAFT_1456877 [Suillus spraguei]
MLECAAQKATINNAEPVSKPKKANSKMCPSQTRGRPNPCIPGSNRPKKMSRLNSLVYTTRALLRTSVLLVIKKLLTSLLLTDRTRQEGMY